MTIASLPKHIRRKSSHQGQVLLVYLPTSKLDHIKNKSARRRTLANLFHACLRFIVKPLEKAWRNGEQLISGDGAVRNSYPILAAYVGDYPEQVLVACVKSGECPSCPADRKGIGELDSVCEPRDNLPILEALATIFNDTAANFTKACINTGIKPIQYPFWQNLPYVNIYRSITPDILHQIYQGIVKHVISWVRSVCGDAEIDARCRRLPPNHHIRLFMKGISNLSRVTGTEHDQITRFILGLIIDVRLPQAPSQANNSSNMPRLLSAVRAILDFVYLARYPVHSEETLDLMQSALELFHINKQIFIDLGIRQNFDIPKFHFVGHYRFFIELYGTTDNTNTEYTERLHIDLAKDAYRSTNRKDEYPQMTAWLDRRERIFQHEKYLRQRLSNSQPNMRLMPQIIPNLVPPRMLKMAKHPSCRRVSFDDLHSRYGALNFEAALSRFVLQHQNPELSKPQIERAVSGFHIPFHSVSVYHRIKFVSVDLLAVNPLHEVVVDSIHVEPARLDKYNKVIPGRFDTAMVNFNGGDSTGVKGKLYLYEC